MLGCLVIGGTSRSGAEELLEERLRGGTIDGNGGTGEGEQLEMRIMSECWLAG
jgi:hypothetical protein